MDVRRYKLTFVGPEAAGKTHYLHTLASGEYPNGFIPYYSESHIFHLMHDGESVLVELVDTAPQTDYDKLRPLGYSTTNTFMIAFSLQPQQRDAHLAEVQTRWKDEILEHVPDASFMLIGMKSDLLGPDESRALDYESLARRMGAKSYMECSSLQNSNHNLFAVIQEGLLIADLRQDPHAFLRRDCMLEIANHYGFPRPLQTAPPPPSPISRSQRDNPVVQSQYVEHFRNIFLNGQKSTDLTILPNDSPDGIRVHKFIIQICSNPFYKVIEPMIDPKTNAVRLDAPKDLLTQLMTSIYAFEGPLKGTRQDYEFTAFAKKINIEAFNFSPRPKHSPDPVHPFRIMMTADKIDKDTAVTLGCDVCLDIGYNLYAHWPVLISRSFFFQNLSESFEPVKGQITTVPFERGSSSIWRKIVYYLYCDKMDPDCTLPVLFDFYAHCDRYMLGDHAAQCCEDEIIAKTTVDTVLQVWDFAKDEKKLRLVKNHCKYLLCVHKAELKLTPQILSVIEATMQEQGWGDQERLRKFKDYQEAVTKFQSGQKPYKEFVFPKELQQDKCSLQ